MSEENTETWELWSYCAGQVRTSGLGDIIGIDYNALFQVAIVLGIEVTPGILKKDKCDGNDHAGRGEENWQAALKRLKRELKQRIMLRGLSAKLKRN